MLALIAPFGAPVSSAGAVFPGSPGDRRGQGGELSPQVIELLLFFVLLVLEPYGASPNRQDHTTHSQSPDPAPEAVAALHHLSSQVALVVEVETTCPLSPEEPEKTAAAPYADPWLYAAEQEHAELKDERATRRKPRTWT
jgi:hypothetical protein